MLVQVPVFGDPVNSFNRGSFGMGNDSHLPCWKWERLERNGKHVAFASGNLITREPP